MRISDWSSDVCSSDLFSTMRAGLPVTMQVDALPGRTFAGTVDRVSPVIDAGSGTFRVTAAFEGGHQLQQGMFGRLDLVNDQRADALTIPRDALIEGDGETAVFVLRDNKAVRTPVQVGFMNGGYDEIRRSEEHKSEHQSLMRTSYS